MALDSRANLDNWQHRLTTAEVDRIRELTADVAYLYYTDAELDNFAAAYRSVRRPSSTALRDSVDTANSDKSRSASATSARASGLNFPALSHS